MKSQVRSLSQSIHGCFLPSPSCNVLIMAAANLVTLERMVGNSVLWHDFIICRRSDPTQSVKVSSATSSSTLRFCLLVILVLDCNKLLRSHHKDDTISSYIPPNTIDGPCPRQVTTRQRSPQPPHSPCSDGLNLQEPTSKPLLTSSPARSSSWVVDLDKRLAASQVLGPRWRWARLSYSRGCSAR